MNLDRMARRRGDRRPRRLNTATLVRQYHELGRRLYCQPPPSDAGALRARLDVVMSRLESERW